MSQYLPLICVCTIEWIDTSDAQQWCRSENGAGSIDHDRRAQVDHILFGLSVKARGPGYVRKVLI